MYNKSNDELKREDLTFIGEAEKIVAVGADDYIRGKIFENANEIGNIKVHTGRIKKMRIGEDKTLRCLQQF